MLVGLSLLVLFFVSMTNAQSVGYYCLNSPATLETDCGGTISCTDEVQQYCCCCTDSSKYGECNAETTTTTTISPNNVGEQVISCLGENSTWDFDGIKNQGSSPGFKMYLTCDGKDYFVQFQFQSIDELDSNGKSTGNNVASLASSSNSWTWVGPEVTNTTVSYSLNGTVTPKKASHSASLTITTTLAKSELSIEYANSTIIVPQNAVKWSIEMYDWEFSSTGEYLYFEIKVGTGGGISKSLTYDTNGDNKMTVDDWISVSLDNQIELIDSQGNVTGTDNATVTVKNKGNSGYFVYYTINKFDYGFNLDPTVEPISYESSPANRHYIQLSAIVGLISLVFVFM